jgi:hypothetical protein
VVADGIRVRGTIAETRKGIRARRYRGVEKSEAFIGGGLVDPQILRRARRTEGTRVCPEEWRVTETELRALTLLEREHAFGYGIVEGFDRIRLALRVARARADEARDADAHEGGGSDRCHRALACPARSTIGNSVVAGRVPLIGGRYQMRQQCGHSMRPGAVRSTT